MSDQTSDRIESWEIGTEIRLRHVLGVWNVRGSDPDETERQASVLLRVKWHCLTTSNQQSNPRLVYGVNTNQILIKCKTPV